MMEVMEAAAQVRMEKCRAMVFLDEFGHEGLSKDLEVKIWLEMENSSIELGSIKYGGELPPVHGTGAC
ncbi:hypothetical protein V6N13_074619 [Hibiscus sabdariffa]